MISTLFSAMWPWSSCPCATDTAANFLGFRVDDVRLLLWLLRDLGELGLPLRMTFGALLLALAKVILKFRHRFPERWHRQSADVMVDWLMFISGILFAGPVWIVANIVHNCLYYNQLESVWFWMILVPVVAQGEGLIMFLLPAGAPAPASMWEKCRQVADLIWCMRQ